MNQVTCAEQSLFIMLRLRGIKLSLDGLHADFPPPMANSHSMRDIQNVARKYGISLRGIELKHLKGLRGRPAIILMRNQGHGHFIVVREFGFSDTLVQVLDPAQDACVVDLAALTQRADWTGYALVERREGSQLPLALLFALLLWLLFTFMKRIQASRLVKKKANRL